MGKKRPKRRDDEDRPMTEEEWEEFMRESDLRAARFGELLETLHEDPDRHAKINREMGWDKPRAPDEYDPEREAIQRSLEEANRELTEEERAELDEMMEEEDRALEAIPAYQKALALAHRVIDVMKAYEGPDYADDEDLSEACSNALIPGAKIAGGHGMGYDDEVIGGNIVNNKRALEAIIACQEAWRRLKQRNVLDTKTADSVLADIADLRHEIEKRIEELRAKVWW